MTAAMRQVREQAISALLDAIEDRRRRMTVLQTYGVRAAGLGDLSHELDALRAELASTVGLDS